MLSPNARSLVKESRGGGCTVTPNVQELERALKSVTVQVTVVDPTEKPVPLAGVQVGPVNGLAPPATVGAP
jgi:hypothetical protein